VALHAVLVHCQIDEIIRDSQLLKSMEKEMGKAKKIEEG